MKLFLKHRTVFIAIGVVILIVGGMVARPKDESATWTTDTISLGEVSQIVSVSGIVEADDRADLSFSTQGTVSTVLVRAGDVVHKGQILATLEQTELLAERDDAYGALITAEANRDELLTGPRTEAREVTDVTVSIARENLNRITAEEDKKVSLAYRTLLSSGLEAVPDDKENDDIPPTISGTYTCGNEGEYTLTVFRSGAQSGYSYRLSGLETGTYTAYTETPAPLGTCGLSIQFAADEIYASKVWHIYIPNTQNTTYVSDLNAYELAVKQRDNSITAAVQALEKAEKEQILENAAPRVEARDRAAAAVIQAQARLSAVDARIEDRTLRAPFDGVVSDVDIVPGEAAGSAIAITLVADTLYELSVRIPEIDITKLKIGQLAEVTFDARANEVVPAEIVFISPIATMIDGVAYFEAKLRFTNPPEWLRGGLNADVDVIVERKNDVLRLPKRFLIEENGVYHVRTPAADGKTTVTTPLQIGFVGNNGYTEILSGIADGAVIVAP